MTENILKVGKVYAGTSGWMYRHWIDYFYPRSLPSKDWLRYICHTIPSIEINNTFYKMPDETSIKKLYGIVPDDYIFSVKVNREITHGRKLYNCGEVLNDFLSSVEVLKEKIGVILFQLPPSFNKNLTRLSEFIKILPPRFRYTFEFRNNTWWSGDVYEVLRKFNIAFTLFQMSGRITPNIITADFVYVRLHGQQMNPYTGQYHESTLKAWARLIGYWTKSGKDVYFYFDNDEKAYAVYDAIRLNEMLRKS